MKRPPLPRLLAGIVETRRMCMFDPYMLPIVQDGVVYAANVDTLPPPLPGLSVEDFVLGYLALGWHQVPIMDGDFGTAICIDYDPLPSRWRDRAIALHRAFGPDLGSVRYYFRETGLGLLVAALPDDEMVARFGTPRRSLIAYALIMEARRNDKGKEDLEAAVRQAEPTATDAEIEAVAHAVLDLLDAVKVPA